MNKNPSTTSSAYGATGRLFRAYAHHCSRHDEDALFGFLAALHSFGDRIAALGRPNMSACADFLALRALRNYFHHNGEVPHEVRLLKVAEVHTLVSDLQFLCIVPATTVDMAFERMRNDGERHRATRVIRRYDAVVDIEPNIFNVMVHAYELVVANGTSPKEEDAFNAFEVQYEFETQNGYDHRVAGMIHTHAASVGQVLAKLLGPVRA